MEDGSRYLLMVSFPDSLGNTTLIQRILMPVCPYHACYMVNGTKVWEIRGTWEQMLSALSKLSSPGAIPFWDRCCIGLLKVQSSGQILLEDITGNMRLMQPRDAAQLMISDMMIAGYMSRALVSLLSKGYRIYTK